MKSNRHYIIPHVSGCIIFLFLALLLSPHPPHESILTFSKPMQRDFIAHVLMLVFFYLNFYLLIPKLYFQERFVVYFFFVAASFTMVCLLPSLVTLPGLIRGSEGIDPFHRNYGKPFPRRPESSFLFSISHHIFLFLAVVLFSLLLKVRGRLYHAETARQQAELSYLKAQINPHFLFNTLNSIYSFALAKDERTPEAVIQLSELMRYIIRDAGSNLVPLEKEVNYINNYIALQQSRLGNTVQIYYTVQGNTGGRQIAPLIMITYIENAFKHGVNPDKHSEIKIAISVLENELSLLVYNRKVNTSNDEYEIGIGEKNTRERLELLYKNKYKLLRADEVDSYTVKLKILLT